MANKIDKLQKNYIRDMRVVQPVVQHWWSGLVEKLGLDEATRRWPTGPSGHPSVIEVFRSYYFEIEELNLEAEDEFEERPPKPWEEMWGAEDDDEAPRVEREIDRLIYDMTEKAPDLELLVFGLVFVPIGLDQDDESC
ncbi:hypothetical protein EOC93_01920 [Mesorhizobium sp. M6A.T.Ce.TU.002.03.1.1]|uniref:hypothetical protein n=1 Tax=unclassified Mesorhizobium TaxID=325217 RepID=UPI000FCAA2A4|nr:MULTISPECIES: hypothetical protein [unclassified Mesorhizobium]RUU39406.1 hypothetical protein EOD08_14960 [Mesorhizobium sp. M6A.T.Ca.TU.002.02.2.1]RUU31544.1 hypothetical protein EOC94_05300 [Mesorhizobium sp. M6A.T.Ce.TU.016.01.1.1]RUU46812.1 hypothetical protein EOC93_01920 [Mesorhizobium sp. M6A.T.Ce.TU.002.03.1.1]RWP71102.1 MAG: hypothetical protein EOR10_30545 [Mesorhizobium sp.]RWP79880.1 MAG: hypothetical protein EOR09_01350 [Mesorhizobium sp.]